MAIKAQIVVLYRGDSQVWWLTISSPGSAVCVGEDCTRHGTPPQILAQDIAYCSECHCGESPAQMSMLTPHHGWFEMD